MLSSVAPPHRPIASDVAFAHDCRQYDGMFASMRVAMAALEGSPIRVRVYTCYDPSLEDQYPHLGTMVPGYSVPFGGDLERAVNRFFPVFARRLRTVQADIIHVWSIALAGLLRYRKEVWIAIPDLAKFTTRLYGRIPSYLHNRMIKYAVQARGITCLTEWGREEVIAALKLPEDRVFVVPPWVPIPPAGNESRTHVIPPTTARPWTLLCVAADRPHKNIGLLLRVLSRLDDRFVARIVTRPTPGTRVLAQKLGVADRVRFIEGVTDMDSVYDRAQILVHPSLYEGFGLPMLEAMARGIPVIATDRTSVPEVVSTGGTVLPPEHPEAWVEAIRRLADPGQYARSSQLAILRAGWFSRDRTRSALLRAYGTTP